MEAHDLSCTEPERERTKENPSLNIQPRARRDTSAGPGRWRSGERERVCLSFMWGETDESCCGQRKKGLAQKRARVCFHTVSG
ncbi:hypothetical protein AOLI_G00283310 [Acnodon oligacanthus]